MIFNCNVCGNSVHLGSHHEVTVTSSGRQIVHCNCKSSQEKVVSEGASKASCTTQTNPH